MMYMLGASMLIGTSACILAFDIHICVKSYDITADFETTGI